MKALKLMVFLFIGIALCIGPTACGNHTIVGTWETEAKEFETTEAKLAETTGTIEFKENGEFVSLSYDLGGEEKRAEGTYKIDGSKLTIVPDGYASTEHVFEIDGDKLTLTFENGAMEFIRK